MARPTFRTPEAHAGAAAKTDGTAQADLDAARQTAALYRELYPSLVRLAALLVRDVATAEEIVQESFIGMHANWHRLRSSDKASPYLRQCVVNKSRSVLRHRMVTERHMPPPPPDEPSAEQGALALLERSAVIAALQELPQRQREALVLRFYAELPEAEIASAMGISRGSVKSHIARARAALRVVLKGEV